MRLGVCGRHEDPLSRHTVDVARARGHDAVLLAFADMISGAHARCVDGAFAFAGEELASFDALVLRRVPSLPAQLGPADAVATGAEWWKREKLQEERASFAWSALRDAELQGALLVNPTASLVFDHKPLQLAAFLRAGLPIPRTVVTTARADVLALERAVGEFIVKPCAGGAAARALDDKSRALLDGLEAPIIAQERVRGVDLRVTVVGGVVVSAVEVHKDADVVDYRDTLAWTLGETGYTPHDLPDDVKTLCVRAAAVCGHVLSGIDLVRTPAGRTVILEANSAPSTLDIEEKTRAPITARLVQWLEEWLEQTVAMRSR